MNNREAILREAICKRSEQLYHARRAMWDRMVNTQHKFATAVHQRNLPLVAKLDRRIGWQMAAFFRIDDEILKIRAAIEARVWEIGQSPVFNMGDMVSVEFADSVRPESRAITIGRIVGLASAVGEFRYYRFPDMLEGWVDFTNSLFPELSGFYPTADMTEWGGK